MSDRSASEVEVVPLRTAAESYDVAILGGGLAGLTLAMQLKRQRPDTAVVVLEKRVGPAPLAAFKVGESTVPAGAHYFAKVVGMENHLKQRHLIKFGLRFFTPTEDNSDLSERGEFGVSFWPAQDNFQIDRGLFENELATRARGLGVDVLQGCRVGEVDLDSGDAHTVNYTQAEAEQSVNARWVVDAAGRASLLKRKLGLSKEIPHTINSSWLRLAGGLDLEQWGAHNIEWMSKMPEPGVRQYSTNHLLGEGYWVWLIPLSSGPISIGVCADPRIHPFEEISDVDSWLDWMRRHEPQLAASIEPRRGDIEDFLRIEDFAYGVDQAYSTDRWALVGEAGAFADPFYSPGSDFIGYGNTFTTDLITRDLENEDITERTQYFNDLYQKAFAHVMSKYEDHYETMGQPAVMWPKLTWDSLINHYVQTLLFIQGRLADLEFVKSVEEDLDAVYRLHERMEQLFLDWRGLEKEIGPYRGGIGFHPLLRATLAVSRELSDEELRDEVRHDRECAEAMAVAIFHHAAEAVLPEQPDPERAINPYAVSMQPDRWEEDGLYDDENGVTLARAKELTDFPAFLGGPPGGGPPAGVGGPPPGVGGPPGGFPPGGPPAGFPPGGPPGGFPPGGPPAGFPPGGPPGGFPPGGPPPGVGGPPPGVGGPPRKP